MAAVKPGVLAAVNPAALSPETVRTANELRDRIVAGSKAADWVRDITDLAGPRMPGSPGDRAAVALTLSMLKAQGFANVRAEKVVVPVWERGVETGEVLSPARQKLILTALGGSIGTPEGGLEGEVVRFRSLEELALAGSSARGKIAFIDRPTARTSDGSGYGSAGDVRGSGPSAAARQGAIGLLIRSIGTDDERAPHTGGMRYADDAPKIPAAALAAPDAALLTRLLARGPVKVKFTLGCRTLPDGESANVIGEIPGREIPKEIVLLGAHLDSWDLGTGALDDAAGCGIVDRSRAADRAASPSEAPAAHDPRRSLRERGERAEGRQGVRGGARGGARGPRRGPRGRPGSGAASRILVERRSIGQGDTRSDRGTPRADRRRRPQGVRRRRSGSDLSAALGHPEPRPLARRDRLLRLPPHGERQLRPHRSEDPGPLDRGRGDARLRARRDPGAARTHRAREARLALMGTLRVGQMFRRGPDESAARSQPCPLTFSRTACTSGCWNPRSSAMRRASWFSAAVSVPSE